MARWRHAVEQVLTDEEIEGLGAIARSRSEPARRVERARMLLAYRENSSFFAVGQRLPVHHQTVQRCVERAVAYGPLAARDESEHMQRTNVAFFDNTEENSLSTFCDARAKAIKS